MSFLPDFSKHTVSAEVAAHERKQLKWFLIACLFLLIGTGVADFILSSHGKANIPPAHNPLVNATPTPLLLPSPTPQVITPVPTTHLPSKSASSPAGMKFCTQEAKLCPDGKTYVSRTGPNCAFAACPQ